MRSQKMKLTILLLLVMMLPGINSAVAAERIVSLAPHITELLYAIGAGDKLVGVSDYSDYPQQAQALPRVASYASINIEAVLALQPDLIIAWKSGSPHDDVQRLQQMGLKVAFSDPKQLTDIATELMLLGQLTGYADEATQVATDFQQTLTQLKSQFSGKQPVPVFFEMSSEPLSTVANNAWAQQALTLCAADNIFSEAKGDYPLVNIEQILLANPHVIIQAKAATKAANFNYWQRFTDLPAVKKRQFLSVDADYLFRATPRTLLGIRQLCMGIDEFR